MDTTPDFLTDMDAVLKHQNVSWAKNATPDYSTVNQLYLKERLETPEKGSLEEMITNLMKNWEKEIVHKANPVQWVTMSADTFTMSVNGEPFKDVKSLASIGSYNAFVGDTEYYCGSKVRDQAWSDRIFRTALPTGFAWECVQVYTKPPLVVCKWRHWGYMRGELKCPRRSGVDINIQGHGGRVEIFGMTTIKLNGNFQILQMEHFFRPDHLMEQMVQGESS